MSDLVNALTTLGLRHTAAHLDDVVALATKRRWSTTQLLEYLAESEQQERTRRSLERRLLRSRLGRFTPMSGSTSSRARATSCSWRPRASARR